MLKKLLLIPALALTFTAFATPAQACLWDEDTLAQEAEGIEDVVSVVLGAFPRNPAAYYETRLTRAKAAIAKDVTAWKEYDNAAVACDRLGKSDDAIALMVAKQKAMKAAKYDASKEKQPNHSYRTKANLGTFYVHRWLKAGKDWEKMEDVTKAKKLIAEAIKENPDAHFGREVYQLKAIEWIASKPLETKATFSKYGSPQVAYPDMMGIAKRPMAKGKPAIAKENKALDKMIKGLAGLMKMGNAWRSLDVLYAMKAASVIQSRASIVAMIEARMAELRKEGATLMVSTAITAEDKKAGAKGKLRFKMAKTWTQPYDEVIAENKKLYTKNRAAVKKWHAERTAFLTKKLAKKEHPDTSKDFWKGFKDPMGFKVDTGKKAREGAGAWGKKNGPAKRSRRNGPAEGKPSSDEKHKEVRQDDRNSDSKGSPSDAQPGKLGERKALKEKIKKKSKDIAKGE